MNQVYLTHHRERSCVSSYQHICTIYRGAEERRAILKSYIMQGLQLQEQIICVGECFSLSENSVRQSSVMPNQLKLKSLAHFIPEGEDILRPSKYTKILLDDSVQALLEGFHGLRLVIEMACGQSFMTSGQFVILESALENMPSNCPCTVLCLYNDQRFLPSLLSTVLQAHPLVATAMRIIPNAYYKPYTT